MDKKIMTNAYTLYLENFNALYRVVPHKAQEQQQQQQQQQTTTYIPDYFSPGQSIVHQYNWKCFKMSRKK